ncbi:flavodoxin [Ramlibacter humi]|uniref:Flavodoxin n=1 Tax=Ramlibacter humi TaxID=2530451 RepID=A0A4Z0CDS5_9BURK|nr:flavodoxin [Ramlibacter humi]TFZ08650.1 flavodoxin [Ramlibacter humi]
MNDTLVIFYCLGGTSREVAHALADEQGWALGQVVEAKPRGGWPGLLRCALDTLRQRLPPVRYEGPEPAGFQRVVLVAPIWLGSVAAPMRSFAASAGRSWRQYAVVTTSATGESSRAEAELAAILGHEPIGCAAFHTRHVTDGSYAPVLQEFGGLLAGIGYPVARPQALGAIKPAPAG